MKAALSLFLTDLPHQSRTMLSAEGLGHSGE